MRWRLVAASGDGAAAFRAFALDHDSEPVGAQRVAESERSLGVAAPSVVEQDCFSSSLMVPQAARAFGEEPFRSHSGMAPTGSGPYPSRRYAASQSMIAMPQPPFLFMLLDYPTMRKPSSDHRSEGLDRSTWLRFRFYEVGVSAGESAIPTPNRELSNPETPLFLPPRQK